MAYLNAPWVGVRQSELPHRVKENLRSFVSTAGGFHGFR
jgi:hypothetical protein